MPHLKQAVDGDGGKATRSLPGPFLLLSMAVAIALAVVAVYPLMRVVIGLFFVDGQFTVEPIAAMFGMRDLAELVFNTVVVVGVSSVFALLLGTAMAWLNERTDARMGALTDSLPLIPFLIPPIAGAIGWVLLLSPTSGLLNAVIRAVLGWFGVSGESGPLDIFSWPGLIFVYTLYQVPYAYMTVSAGLRNVDSSLEEQSRVCGAGFWRTTWRVTIPSIRPALGGAVLLMLVQGLSLFSIPVIIGTGADIEVLAVRIVELLTFSYPPRMAEAIGLSVIMIVLVGAAWLAQDRVLRSGRHSTLGGKGQRLEVLRLRGWRPVARAAMLLYGALAIALPVGGLLLVTLNGFWTPAIDWGALSLRWLDETVFQAPLAMRSLGNSLLLGVVGATVGITAAAIISVLIARHRGRWSRVVDGAIKIPAVVSHLVIGVGMILAFAGAPFALGGTVAILLIAYIAIYLPQGSVSSDAAVSQVGHELAEASAVAGSGYGRTFRRIYLPLILPSLVAGWAYLFARMAGDLTATAILSGPSNITVGFMLLQTYQNGSYGQLAPLAVVLTLLSTAVVVSVIAIANHWSRRQSRARRSSAAANEVAPRG